MEEPLVVSQFTKHIPPVCTTVLAPVNNNIVSGVTRMGQSGHLPWAPPGGGRNFQLRMKNENEACNILSIIIATISRWLNTINQLIGLFFRRIEL